jgi:hypothetical protein
MNGEERIGLSKSENKRIFIIAHEFVSFKPTGRAPDRRITSPAGRAVSCIDGERIRRQYYSETRAGFGVRKTIFVRRRSEVRRVQT